jgi:hypothetical protein
MLVRAPLLVLLVAVLVLPGCGSGDGGAPATTPSPGAARTVRGYGFTAAAPPGWTDVSGQFEAEAVRYDVAYGDTRAVGFKPSLLVLRERTQEIRGRTIAQVDARIRRAGPRAPEVRMGTSTPLRLDGEDALTRTTTGTQAGAALAKREVLSVHDGTLYTIALTAAADDRSADGVLRAFVASWRWRA